MDHPLLEILAFAGVGFAAQLVDGALGMAYGVTSTSVLLSLGVSPALASASVHTAEVVTSGVSGLSHLRFGNVQQEMFRRLVVPGVIGGVVGAYLLTLLPGEAVRPFVAAYLLLMGLRILLKALKKLEPRHVTTHLVPLGLAGGFLDALGGGGWGPIVTTSLVARGHDPRYAIGSVNLAEFFVTLSQTAIFLLVLRLTHWQIVTGLVLGGVLAAPLAAFTSRRLPTRALMVIVGVLVVLLSLRTIVLSLS